MIMKIALSLLAIHKFMYIHIVWTTANKLPIAIYIKESGSKNITTVSC